MVMRRCNDCRRLYDRDAAPGYRCPACQQASEKQRDQRRGSPAERGYGHDHRAERERQVAAFTPGQPCARCGQPIASADDADLGHTDDRTSYRGLECRRCNRGAPRRDRHKPTRTWPAASRSQADDDSEAGSDDDWIGIA